MSPIQIKIDLFEELFIHWIPAFARKTFVERCFAQPPRLPRECGDPDRKQLLAEVNAFARKTKGVGRIQEAIIW